MCAQGADVVLADLWRHDRLAGVLICHLSFVIWSLEFGVWDLYTHAAEKVPHEDDQVLSCCALAGEERTEFPRLGLGV